ncbi:immunoglobulin-like domain-containing protein [Sphingobacterium kyonggiense]
MRKSSILIISAILILGCGQSKGGNETSRTNRATVQELESTNRTVELTAQPATLKISELPDSITVKVTNNTNDTITTGLLYRIERFEADGWKDVSPKDIVIPDLGWRIVPNGSETFTKKLYKDRINYTAGKYRILKDYIKSDYQKRRKKFNVSGEFNIEE